METTKYDIARDTGVQHQEALVKKKLNLPKGRKRHVIPGGKTMMDREDGPIQTERDLTEAIYTWLRYIRFFNEVRLSFARDPERFKVRTNKIQEFDALPNGDLIWQVHPDRKHYLATCMAKAIYSTKGVVAVDVTKNGISILVDSSGEFNTESPEWEPYVEFLPNYKAKGEYVINRS